jgi:hypothetical protein
VFCQLQFERTDWSPSRGQAWSRFRICSFPEFQQRILSRSPNIPPASKELDGGKSIRLEDLENELEAYAPLIKCETKCEKAYCKCPRRNRFQSPMIVRTVREVVTGSILIETCAMSHCHGDSNEKFQRGLSFRVQESIR